MPEALGAIKGGYCVVSYCIMLLVDCVVLYGMLLHGTAWYCIVWHCTTWHGIVYMIGYCIISYDMVSRVVYLVLLGGESRRLFGNHLAPSPSINLDMNAKSVSILF